MCSVYLTNKPSSIDITDNALMKSRGPDGMRSCNINGYTLVHTLLHLTGTRVDQPVHDQANDIYVLFNGEIYNYLNIDRDAPSDVYSILSAYIRYGVNFAKHLDGEFSVVVFDIKRGSIVFTSDIFGTKPLFYAVDGQYIGICTYKSILKKSGFNSIYRVAPNTTYKFNTKTYELNTTRIKTFCLRQYKNTFCDWIEAFEQSVCKRALHSSPNKLFTGLSSGYDSGAIACCINKLDVDNLNYCLTANENVDLIRDRGEYLKAIKMLSMSKIEYTRWKMYVQRECENHIIDTGFDDNVRNDRSSPGLAYICNLAKKTGRKIYLSGHGSDEIISDYGMNGFDVTEENQYSTYRGLFPENLQKTFPWKNFFGGVMPGFLAKEEYIAGSFGIEARYPFLDARVVQEFLWLSADLKSKYYKAPLHAYLQNNNFPFELNTKRPFLPI